jgi:hypothetical protein
VLHAKKKGNDTMGISLTNMEKCQRTNSTFAIRTSHRLNLKLQKSYFGQTQDHVILFEYYKDNINKTGILTILQC